MSCATLCLGRQVSRVDPETAMPLSMNRDVFITCAVTGAGDTVLAAYTLALACGAPPLEAAHIANIAGGLVVMKRGTATVSQQELLDAIGSEILAEPTEQRMQDAPAGRIATATRNKTPHAKKDHA